MISISWSITCSIQFSLQLLQIFHNRIVSIQSFNNVFSINLFLNSYSFVDFSNVYCYLTIHLLHFANTNLFLLLSVNSRLPIVQVSKTFMSDDGHKNRNQSQLIFLNSVFFPFLLNISYQRNKQSCLYRVRHNQWDMEQEQLSKLVQRHKSRQGMLFN